MLLAGSVTALLIAAERTPAIKVVTLADGLDHPWSLAFLPDGRMLVTERPGRLRVIEKGRLLPQAVSGVPAVVARGQGGLLDVVPHPQFSKNRWIYLSYSAAGKGGQGTEVGRGRLEGLQLRDWQVIFTLEPKTGTNHHFGSRLVFDRDGSLFITIGDRGDDDRSQDLGDPAGSVLRLHDDGRIPADNPFIKTAGARGEIYSYGHRSPQGAALHPGSGKLWMHEHGPQGGDEINVVMPGINYGWPVITYGRQYGSGFKIGEGTHKQGMAQPVHYWVPSIAPSGMAFYTGDKFPQWQGNLFVGALAGQALVRLELEGEKIRHEQRLFQNELGRLRDVRNGPDGYLYLLTDQNPGRLLRLEPG